MRSTLVAVAGSGPKRKQTHAVCCRRHRPKLTHTQDKTTRATRKGQTNTKRQKTPVGLTTPQKKERRRGGAGGGLAGGDGGKGGEIGERGGQHRQTNTQLPTTTKYIKNHRPREVIPRFLGKRTGGERKGERRKQRGARRRAREARFSLRYRSRQAALCCDDRRSAGLPFGKRKTIVTLMLSKSCPSSQEEAPKWLSPVAAIPPPPRTQINRNRQISIQQGHLTTSSSSSTTITTTQQQLSNSEVSVKSSQSDTSSNG